MVAVVAGAAVAHPQTQQYMGYELPKMQQYYAPKAHNMNLRVRPNTGSVSPLRRRGTTTAMRHMYPYYGTTYAVMTQAQREFAKRRGTYAGSNARANNTKYGYPNHVIRNGNEIEKGDAYMAILENNKNLKNGQAYGWWNAPKPLFQVPRGYTEVQSGTWESTDKSEYFQTYYLPNACSYDNFVSCVEQMAVQFAQSKGGFDAPLYTSFRWIMSENHGVAPSYTEYFMGENDQIFYTFTAFDPNNGKTLRLESTGAADNYYADANRVAKLFRSVQF